MLARQTCATLSQQRMISKATMVEFQKLKLPEDLAAREEAVKNFIVRNGIPLPPSNAPHYDGAYTDEDLARVGDPLDTMGDDGQAFLDSMNALDRINEMLDVAHRRRDDALNQIATGRRNFGERLRSSSNRIIEGEVNKERASA